MNNKAIYRQADDRWARLPFPGGGYNIKGCGCGCCSVTHVIIELDKYKKYTPKNVQPYMIQFATRQGLYHYGIPTSLKHYGLEVIEVGLNDPMSKAWKYLGKDGYRAGVLLFYGKDSRGRFIYGPDGTQWTRSGHFIAFVDYKIVNGKHWFYLKDSGDRISTHKNINGKFVEERHNGWWCYENSMKRCLPKLWLVKIPGGKIEKKLETPTMKEIRADSNGGIIYDILKWQNKIAKDNSYHYVTFSDDKRTQTCPICNPKSHKESKYRGWNCIGAEFASLRHGGGIKSKCNCHVIDNSTWNKILRATDSDALSIAKKRIGVDDIKVIRNGGKAIPLSKLKAGDVIVFFNSVNQYYHTAGYQGDDKYFDCTSGRKDEIKSGNTLSKGLKADLKVAIRYIGTRDYISTGCKGESVKKIQRIVGVIDDGDFGSKTRKAVKRWQKANGLPSDGKVGKSTLAKMKEVIK